MKIFKMNDCDWYAAETLEDAKKAMAADMGVTIEEVDEEYIDGAHEITDGLLDKLIFKDEDSPEEEELSEKN
jgi:hypothetical protein